MNTSSDILQRVWELSPPHSVHSGWERFAVSNEMRIRDANAKKLYRDLSKSYAAEDLVTARVITRPAAGKYTFSPVLAPAGAPLIALREAADCAPYDIIGPAGCVVAETAPIVAALRDYRISARGAETGTLFVTGSLADAGQLLAVGLAAVPLEGLESPDVETVQAINGLFEDVSPGRDFKSRNNPSSVEPGDNVAAESVQSVAPPTERDGAAPSMPADDAPPTVAMHPPGPTDDEELDDDEPVNGQEGCDRRHDEEAPEVFPGQAEYIDNLVFVNWSVSAFDMASPPGMAGVLDRWRQLQDCEAVSPHGIVVWEPTSSELQTLRNRLTYGSVDDVRGFLLDSASGAQPLVPPVPRPRPTFQSAWNSHFEFGKSHPDRRASGNTTFSTLVWQRCIEPLLAQAEQSVDPMEISRLLGLAKLLQLQHGIADRMLKGPPPTVVDVRAYDAVSKLVERLKTTKPNAWPPFWPRRA